MTRQRKRRILITASVEETCDGLMRLAGDAQRFGFEVTDVQAIARADGSAFIHLTILTDSSADCDMLGSRLSRHPVIQDLQAVELESDGADECPRQIENGGRARIEGARS